MAHALLGLDIEGYLRMTPVLLTEMLQAAVDARSGKTANAPVRVEYVDEIPEGW